MKVHKYLGTLVEDTGREKDVNERIKDCKGVLNEIVEICKTEAVGKHRFQYMFTLLNSCFMLKFKHGCEVWDSLNKKNTQLINQLIPQAVKRILELPRSTPTNAVKHDFGLINLTNEVELEKILLGAKVHDFDDDRIVKKLLLPMMQKKVPGYCTQLLDLLTKYQITIADMQVCIDQRKMLKKVVVEHEKKILFESMMEGSKTDAMITNYLYSGKMLHYLSDLPFSEGRIIFMFRCRMFPTRVNFPERWTSDLKCVYCCCLDTDEHLFTCWGYVDITEGCNIDPSVFYGLEATMDVLSRGAQVLEKIHDRLLLAQNDSDLCGKKNIV